MLHNLKKLVFDSWIYKKELTKEVFRQEIERLEKFTRGVCVIKKFFKDSQDYQKEACVEFTQMVQRENKGEEQKDENKNI